MADPDSESHARQRRSAKAKLAVVILAALGLLFISLGNWQLRRADERRAVAAQIDAGRSSAPITLSAESDFSALAAWQPVHASGTWLPQWSLLLDNRNLDGKPGLWLATPLSLNHDTALLVLRGWVPRPIGTYNVLPKLIQSTQEIELAGEVLNRVPQLYQIADEEPLANRTASLIPSPDEQTSIDLAALPRRQNVRLTELETWTGINFVPVVLLQTSPTPNETLLRQWPEPSVDADKNIGYAMQWFSFAAIAIGAMGVLLWRTRTRAKIKTNQNK